MDFEQTFLFIVEVVGTLAAAVSGIRMAAAKSFDWFGAFSVGMVTAIGGGTLRDILLAVPVFWMQTWWYLAVVALALVVVIAFRRILVHTRVLFVFDTVGLALFVVIGIQKSLAAGYPLWVAIIMGIITGAMGGVLRDILINNEPLLFKKDLYATACLAGGLVYALLLYCGASVPSQALACAATVIAMRLLAVRFGWSLPVLVAVQSPAAAAPPRVFVSAPGFSLGATRSQQAPSPSNAMKEPSSQPRRRLAVNPAALQFIKYACVGVINTLVTFAVIFLCKSILGVNPWLSNALGYAAGIVNSFMWNKRWVFCTSGHYLREAAVFLSGALVCYGVQLLALWLLFDKTGLRTWQYAIGGYTLSGYGIATVGGNIIYTVSYYIYNKLFTFRH